MRGCHFLKAVGEEIRGRGLGVREVRGGLWGLHDAFRAKRMKGWLHGDMEQISVRGIHPGSLTFSRDCSFNDFIQTTVTIKRG